MEKEVLLRLASLQESSLQAVLEGVLKEICREFKPKGNKRPGGNAKQKSRETSDRLIGTFLFLLIRTHELKDGSEYKKACCKSVHEYLGTEPWMLEMVLRKHMDLVAKLGKDRDVALGPLMEAALLLGETHHAKMFHVIYRSVRRYMESTTDADFSSLVLKEALHQLLLYTYVEENATGKQAVTVTLQRHMPQLLQIASISLSQKEAATDFPEDVLGDVDVLLDCISCLLCQLLDPGALLKLVRGEEKEAKKNMSSFFPGGRNTLTHFDVTERIQTIMSIIEVLVEILVQDPSLSQQMESSQDSHDTKSVQDIVSKLLTVRFELSVLNKLAGYTNKTYSPHVTWLPKIGPILMNYLVQASKAQQYLAMTPPQTVQAIELILMRSSVKDRKGSMKHKMTFSDESLHTVEVLLQLAIRGFYAPNSVLNEQSSKQYQELASSIRETFMKDSAFSALCAEEESNSRQVDEDERAETSDIEEGISNQNVTDGRNEVTEILNLITSHSGMESTTPGQPGLTSALVKTPRRITPEKITELDESWKDPMEEEKNGLSENCGNKIALFQHNGRVFMPGTYGMDAETKEALWKAYIEDKDRLVEMLADSDYKKWHDESKKPRTSKKGGVNSAFDAIFGKYIAESEVAPLNMDATIVEKSTTSLLDSSLSFPWSTLLSGVLKLISCTISVIGEESDAKVCAFLRAVSDENGRRAAVTASLKAVQPNYSRPVWTAACNMVREIPSVGIIIYFAYQMKQALDFTARHTTDTLVESFLQLLLDILPFAEAEYAQYETSISFKGIIGPFNLASGLIRQCITFPPLMGKSLIPTSAGSLPLLTTLDSWEIGDSISYLVHSVWEVWHSIQQDKGACPFFAQKSTCSTTLSVTTASLSSKIRYVCKAMDRLTEFLTSEDCDDVDIRHLQLCSALAGSICLDICSRFIKEQDESNTLDVFARHPDVNTSIFSLIPVIGHRYDHISTVFSSTLKLATDSVSPGTVETIAGALITGMEFIEVSVTYTTALKSTRVERSRFSESLWESVCDILTDGDASIRAAIDAIQHKGVAKGIFAAALKGMQNAPTLVHMEVDTTGVDNSDLSNEDGVKGKRQRTSYEKQKRRRSIRNPFLRAIVDEAGRGASEILDEDLSDLEDFIVADPTKDYSKFIADHFPLPEDSDEEKTII